MTFIFSKKWELKLSAEDKEVNWFWRAGEKSNDLESPPTEGEEMTQMRRCEIRW